VPNRASDEFSGLRVLVVDDSSTSYMLMEEMLANWSAEVSVLNRAKPVADRLQNAVLRGKPYDVVVLDHSLPDGTTDELLRMIRLDRRSPHLRRVAERARVRRVLRRHARDRARRVHRQAGAPVAGCAVPCRRRGSRASRRWRRRPSEGKQAPGRA